MNKIDFSKNKITLAFNKIMTHLGTLSLSKLKIKKAILNDTLKRIGPKIIKEIKTISWS